MNRYAVRIGSLLALALSCLLAQAPARADDRLALQFEGASIALTHVRTVDAVRAVAVDDPGLQELLAKVGATVTWQPGERYVLITTAEPLVVSFAVGDARYDVGPVKQTAPLAPFELNGRVYLPLEELLHAMDLALRADNGGLFVQPQLTALDVQAAAGGARLVARGGIPLDAQVSAARDDKIVITFDGVASTLPPSRSVGTGPVQRIDVRTLGTTAHPQTQVTVAFTPGTLHSAPGTDDQRDFTMAFSAPASEPAQQIAASANPAAPAASQSVAQVTAVDTQPQNGRVIIHIAVSGNAAYEWHRLRPPDNRFWLDVHDARLAIAAIDEPGSDPVTAIRVHQQSPQVVRIALSLAGFDSVDVTPGASGVTITASGAVADEATTLRSGSGRIGAGAVAATGKPYVASNPRLIVIDPGHGGSDPGSYRGELVEKLLTLDISKRLRDILAARGWQVLLTRSDDRDVYAPNDSARDELQARDDLANRNGARAFVSVHVNAFMNAGPHGATVYYYKPSDFALAQAVDKRIAAELDLKNDGVIKNKLYVIHHADMPATLIETAFLSNPDDRALLESAQWRQQMAQAIADGIEDYAGAPPPASSESGQ